MSFQEKKKKIVFFVPEFPVISETFIERELSKLGERAKIDVTVVSLKRGTTSLSSVLLDKTLYIKLSPQDMLMSLKFVFTSPLLVFEAYKLVIRNNKRNYIENLYIFIKSLGYANLLNGLNPDHIHVHFLSEPSTIVMLASIITNTPFSISGHARDVFGIAEDARLNSELIEEKIKRAVFVTLCNKKAYEFCLGFVSSENSHKVLLQYHGVDVAKLSAPDTVTSIPTAPIILSVGRLEEKKGFSYLISAAEILKQSEFNFLLRIIGPGSLFNILNEQIRDLNLQNYVEILGDGKGLQNELVLKEMRNATIFVLPSVETQENDTEGIPNTLIEASLLSLPIVTTKTGSIEELIHDKVTGLLVEQKNPEQLAEALGILLKDSSMRSNLATAAKAEAEKRFDLDTNILKLESLLAKNL